MPLSQCSLSRQPSSPATTTGIESTITESTTTMNHSTPLTLLPLPSPPPSAPNPPPATTTGIESTITESTTTMNHSTLSLFFLSRVHHRRHQIHHHRHRIHPTLLPLPSDPCRFVKNPFRINNFVVEPWVMPV
ncbi:hypothetical protein Acr_23g0001880 [Actinidia rufa]|uniref:Uncharacterized protein n=1 Tax=Actinidia rufa TaxID=165716 RepID=A0A7J0GLX3_9ERIC|nr:hypothetical protein Acr_23g0001880 [Actinidia rufa]